MDLSPGSSGDYWTCDERTNGWDLALVYVTAPFSEVRWLFRADDAARSLENDPVAQQEGWTHGCAYTVLDRFEKTVTFQEMRQAQQLARWDAIGRKLHGEHGAWPVPMTHWRQLVRRIIGRNPGARASFVANMRPVPEWL